jgi:MSHA biogenesis protein MshN
VLRQLKRAPEAAEAYRRAIALQPGEGRWWVGLGMALQDSGRSKEAKEAFTAAREREQTLSPALTKFAEKRSR